MVSRVMRWILGWVRVEAEGGYPERLLNALAAAHVAVWNLRRSGESIRFSCPAGEYRAIRPMARRACVRMRVCHKHGRPFWRHRYRHRRGLLVGLALYIVVLALLSPRIWVIEVTGNTVTPTESILAVARERGVYIGGRMDEVDVKGLQIGGTKDLPTVSFITVNPSHNVARIVVTEREESPPPLDLSQLIDHSCNFAVAAEWQPAQAILRIATLLLPEREAPIEEDVELLYTNLENSSHNKVSELVNSHQQSEAHKKL